MYKAKYILYIVAILSIFLMFSGDSTFAEDVDYNVNIAPALTLTTSTNSLALNLDPSSKTFDSKDLTVTVGTNNATGYKLTLSTPNDNTALERDTTSDTTAISATIPTLDTGTYTESTFTANKWGYSINSNTAIPSTVTSGFIPFTSGNTLMERDTAINHDEAELSFASKIDYLQPAGAYSTTLQFNIVANPPVNYMQDLNPALCTTTPMTVVDKRDNKEYTIAKLPDGNCWMTQNLRYQGDTIGSTSTTTSWVMKSATSNISTDTTMTMTDLTAGDSYTNARYHVATSGQVPSGASYTAEDMGVWYNYAAASAMTITGSPNTNAQVYDICPKGWRLPTNSEQSGITSYASTYSPVAGGRYYNGTLNDAGNGYWWSSTSNSTTFRYYLYWNGSSLNTDGNNRGRGLYVRCVLNDSRTISDITTMQEMNPQIAAKMNNGDTATLKDSRDGQDYTVAKINGNVWMTRNLAIGCNGTGSTYGGAITPIGLTPANTNITSSWTTPTDSLELGDSYDDPRMFCDTTYGAWYNYAATSAGTITGNSNTTTTTSDICPAGWRLATNTEFSSITGYVSAFNPAVGGGWDTGHVSSQHVGVYTSSIAGSAIYRYYLFYDGSSLSVNYSSSERFKGYYVRCIAK